MRTWFKVNINSSIGYMLVIDGFFQGYFDANNQPIEPQPGTSVWVLENDVIGPV